MGTYIPAGPPRKRSISDTLVEAEEEHFLDCPNADFLVRAAALVLDAILFFLIYSALGRLQHLFGAYLAPDFPGAPLTDAEMALNYATWLLRALAFYAFFIWTVSAFGATPGKLLLGLRIVDVSTGRKLSMTRVLLRESGKVGLAVVTVGGGFLTVAFRKDSRALHDLLLRSVVKRIHGET